MMAFNIDTFMQDKKESTKYTFQELSQLFTEKKNELRKVFVKVAQEKIKHPKRSLSKYINEVGFIIMELRNFNRVAQHLLNASYEQMNTERTKLDLSKCSFTDVLREKAYIQKEVDKCLGVRSIDQEISLPPFEEFIESVPTRLKENKHEVHLIRLEWELKQRKQLLTLLAKEEAEKDKVKREIRQLVNHCNSLKSHISKLNEVLDPIHSKLGITQTTLFSKNETLQLLPKALCYLFKQAHVFEETNDMPISISVSGNIEEAKAFDMEHEIVIGPVVKYKKISKDDNFQTITRQSVHWNPISASTDPHLKHPLSIDMVITEKDAVLHIRFHYLIHLHILTVTVESFKAESVIIPLSSFLNCLFPGDDGRISPNMKNKFNMKKAGNTSLIKFSHETTGWPYIWAQKLGNSNYPYNNDKIIEPSDEHITFIETIVRTIQGRIRGRLALHKQICSLENFGSSELPSFLSFCPESNIKYEFKNWKLIPHCDLRAIHPAYESLLEMGIIDVNSIVYKSLVLRDSVILGLYVTINPNYPLVPPFFCLHVNWKTHNVDYTSETHFNLKELEEEINVHCINDLPDEYANDVLSWQLCYLLAIFEIFLETEDALLHSGSEFPSTHVVARPYKGRPHMRPYKYISASKIFT